MPVGTIAVLNEPGKRLAVAVPDTVGAAQLTGLPEYDSVAGVAESAALAPTTPALLNGLSPTKPLTRHAPFSPLPKPEINTEPRPR